MNRTLNAIALVSLAAWCSASAQSVSSQPADAATLTARAEQLEKRGEIRKAAAAYEEIARTEPANARVLAPHLAQLYTDMGDKEPALRWAKEVMKDNPQPDAYLAGIYTRLGMLEEARDLLKKTIPQTADSRQQIMLDWQLAGVCVRLGETQEAEKALKDAMKLAEGTPDEETARRQLEAFQSNRGK